MANPGLRQEIDPMVLTQVVRRMLQQPSADLTTWQIAPLGYAALSQVTGGVFRVTGHVQHERTSMPWSVILKIVHPPADSEGLLGAFLGRTDDPSHYNYWQREPLIYQAGLLSNLPGGIVAPKCFGITEQPNERVWLWLEDIADQYGRQWPLARYGLAAQHLGKFNGAYLAGRQPLPSAPWLTTQIARKWAVGVDTVVTSVRDRVQHPAAWAHPIVQQRLPPGWVEGVLQFWDAREQYLRTMDELPQTFCHHDALQPNLFARHVNGAAQTVAIDWAFAGMGVVGEDLAQLVHGSMFYRPDVAAEASRLEDLAFDQYVSGLRSVGYQGDPQLVRLGYVLSTAIRWGFWGLFWLHHALREAQPSEDDQRQAHMLAERVEHLTSVITFTLRILDEARMLAGTRHP